MKNIVKRIYEGKVGFQRASEIKTQMFFAETSQLLLYVGEMQGQISDGKYENSKPWNHWLWVAGQVEYITKCSGDMGYISNYSHDKTYTILDHIKYITKGEEWANRMLYYAKIGHVLDDLKFFKADDKIDPKEAQAICDVVEYMKDEPIASRSDLDELEKNNSPQYFKNALKTASKYFTDEVLKAYSEYKYDIKNLKEDMGQMNETVNNYLGYKFK
jgi:hypothetical protein